MWNPKYEEPIGMLVVLAIATFATFWVFFVDAPWREQPDTFLQIDRTLYDDSLPDRGSVRARLPVREELRP
jgi:hypothetical protein